jgi:Na+/H+ antiporter NhaA
MTPDDSDHSAAVNPIAIGIVLGLPVGAAVGVFGFDNLALGLLLGAAAGLTGGVALDTFLRRRSGR